MTDVSAKVLLDDDNWTGDLAELLEQLASAQDDLLSLLATKRDLIGRQDHRGLADLAPQEEALGQQLQACQQRRQELLAAAQAEGLPSKSLTELNSVLPPETSAQLVEPLLAARERSKLIRHECLAQWVVVQRTVLHLSQMLEIIATGGRSQPTYGTGEPPRSSGSLMDQAV